MKVLPKVVIPVVLLAIQGTLGLDSTLWALRKATLVLGDIVDTVSKIQKQSVENANAVLKESMDGANGQPHDGCPFAPYTPKDTCLPVCLVAVRHFIPPVLQHSLNSRLKAFSAL